MGTIVDALSQCHQRIANTICSYRTSIDHAIFISLSHGYRVGEQGDLEAETAATEGARRVRAWASCTVTITASGTSSVTPFSATAELTVTNLQVTPAAASLPVGLAQPFTAIATLSDGSTLDVTDDAALSWTSSDTAIATISSSGASGTGVATGVAIGAVTITESGTSGGTPFSATAQLTVTGAVAIGVEVLPAKPDGNPRSGTTFSMPAGAEMRFRANALMSDGSKVDVSQDLQLTWSPGPGLVTSSSTVAKGIVMGVSEGDTTMGATLNQNGQSFSASASLTVRGDLITLGNKIFVPPLTTAEANSLGLWHRAGGVDASTGLNHITYWYLEAGAFCGINTGWNLTLATLDELRELYGALGDMTAQGWPISYTYWVNAGGATNKNLATGVEGGGTTTQRYGACIRIQP